MRAAAFDKQLRGVRDKLTRYVKAGVRLLLAGEPHGPTGRYTPGIASDNSYGLSSAAFMWMSVQHIRRPLAY